MSSRNPEGGGEPADRPARNEEEPSSIWPADRENAGKTKAAGAEEGGSEEEEES